MGSILAQELLRRLIPVEDLLSRAGWKPLDNFAPILFQRTTEFISLKRLLGQKVSAYKKFSAQRVA